MRYEPWNVTSRIFCTETIFNLALHIFSSAVCPTELLALSDRVLDFRALQAEIVACSVDSHLTHLAWARTPRSEGGLGNPKIPLLADPTHSIARDYGVLLSDLGHALR